MAKAQKEVLRSLLPLLHKNIDLQDSEILESLVRDGVITSDDVETYVLTPGSTRQMQVTNLIQLLLHRQPPSSSGEDTLEAVKRALAPDYFFLIPNIDGTKSVIEVRQMEQKKSAPCVRCSLKEELHDVRDVVLPIYQDGYITKEDYEKFSKPKQSRRTKRIEELLRTLADSNRWNHTINSDSGPVQSLSRALADRHPELSERVQKASRQHLVQCRCKGKGGEGSTPPIGTSKKAQQKRLAWGYREQERHAKRRQRVLNRQCAHSDDDMDGEDCSDDSRDESTQSFSSTETPPQYNSSFEGSIDKELTSPDVECDVAMGGCSIIQSDAPVSVSSNLSEAVTEQMAELNLK